MSQRIYLVGSNDPSIKNRLVKANAPSQAIAHVAKQILSVKVASQDDLVNALTQGATVETIKEQE
jgi:hypothetical protein